jgi:hypothetical protein
MGRPERDDAPLADPGGAAGVPNDMPVQPEADDDGAARRPERTEEQPPEPRPDDD